MPIKQIVNPATGQLTPIFLPEANDGTGGSSGGSSSIRQTILSGRTDNNGYADFLRASTGLSVNLLATEVPLVLFFADGFGENGAIDYYKKIDADVVGAWLNLPASSTTYLYVERDPASAELTFKSSLTMPAYAQKLNLTEVVNGVPAMTSDTTPSGIASASNAFSSTYAPWKAFDKLTASESNAWLTATSPPVWLAYQFPVPVQATGYAITPRAGNPTQAPKDFTIRNESGTILQTQTGQTGWSSGRRVFEFSTPVTLQKFEINITINEAGGGNIAIGELEIFATPAFSFHLPQMKFYKRVSQTNSVAKQILFLGEAITGANSVTSLTSYAIQGLYDSGSFSVTAATQSKNHNIGTELIQPSIFLTAGYPTIVQATNKSISFTPSATATARIICRRAF